MSVNVDGLFRSIETGEKHKKTRNQLRAFFPSQRQSRTTAILLAMHEGRGGQESVMDLKATLQEPSTTSASTSEMTTTSS